MMMLMIVHQPPQALHLVSANEVSNIFQHQKDTLTDQSPIMPWQKTVIHTGQLVQKATLLLAQSDGLHVLRLVLRLGTSKTPEASGGDSLQSNTCYIDITQSIRFVSC